VTLRDGSTIVSERDNPQAHAPSVEGMSAKLRELAEGAWTAEQVERVIALVTGDPETPVAELSAAIQGA